MTDDSGPTQIPVFDIVIEQQDLDAVADVLRRGDLAMGAETERFEHDFADHLGVKHAVAVSSCTAALQLSCIAAGIGPGDEVIVPPLTFVATSNAVRYNGATPVFADLVSEGDMGIDPDHAESLITERTKAIIPVHYAGYAVAIERYREICDRHGLALIEDSAHAPDAHVGGKMLGSFGDSACFSFFPNKVLAIGEGGVMVTDDDRTADLARRLRSQGYTEPTDAAFDHDVGELGFSYRFDDPRAAMLNSRFARIHGEVVRRRELIHRYRELLDGVDGLTVPYTDEEVDRSSCYLMAVMTPSNEARREIRRLLTENHKVQTTIYPAVHLLDSYARTYGTPSLPVAESVTSRLLCIPLFPHMTDDDQRRVVDGLAASIEAVGVAS